MYIVVDWNFSKLRLRRNDTSVREGAVNQPL